MYLLLLYLFVSIMFWLLFIIALLQEGILALGFTKDYQLIITGIIVIVAVYADVVARRRKN